MKSAVIQDLLDQCLLTDEEMALGPDQWKETFQHLDNFNLVLDNALVLDNPNLALEEDEEFQGEDEEEGKQGDVGPPRKERKRKREIKQKEIQKKGEKFWGKGEEEEEEEEECKKRCELSG